MDRRAKSGLLVRKHSKIEEAENDELHSNLENFSLNLTANVLFNELKLKMSPIWHITNHVLARWEPMGLHH